MMECLLGCSNWSVPGLDHILWQHLKKLMTNQYFYSLSLWIANAHLATGHWPTEFKASIMVVIPKPEKLAYDTPKAFCPIVLLNIIRKLLDKMLACWMQFEAAEHSMFHPHQFGGVCQNSAKDAGCFLTHLICAGWANNLKASVVAFDLAQFFSSINHDVHLGVEGQHFVWQVPVLFLVNWFDGRI
jgi:hypothetical protein